MSGLSERETAVTISEFEKRFTLSFGNGSPVMLFADGQCRQRDIHDHEAVKASDNLAHPPRSRVRNSAPQRLFRFVRVYAVRSMQPEPMNFPDDRISRYATEVASNRAARRALREDQWRGRP